MQTIRLVTDIPGPQSRALAERRARAVPPGIASSSPIAVVHAENVVLTDSDGNRIIDFAGGIGVLNAGHRHPAVVEAVRSQLDHLTHTCFAVTSYEPYVALAERLNTLTPGDHEKRTLLVNSGAEAVENAVKIARYVTGRQAIVCFEHAFHGRTNLAMALTSKTMPYKKGFGPFVPEVYRIPFPYCYRCPSTQHRLPDDTRHPTPDTRSSCCMAEPGYFDRLFASIVDPSQVAGVVMELQAGEGGFIPAPPDTVRALAAFARQHGILLIIDEVQTGFARTGKLFACEHYGLVPDLITTAKSLAGGLPLGAVTGRAEIMDRVHPGGLGSTYGGNPLACAAALAVLDVMERERLPERAMRLGGRIRSCFCSWADRHQQIGDVRGLGAMVAMELVKDRASKNPDPGLTKAVQAEALKRGLLLLTAGTYNNVLRVLVPLTVEDEVLDEGLAVMEQALRAATPD